MDCNAGYSASFFLTAFILLSTARARPPGDVLEVYPTCGSARKALYFGLMTSFNGSMKSAGVVPGVQVALDVINRMSLLGGHTLHYALYDSQVWL